MNLRYRIVFFGTSSFAVPSLKALLQGPDIVSAVVTQADRPKGRGRKPGPSPVKEVALRYGIPLIQPESVAEDSFQLELRKLQPHLLVVVAYGQILPLSVLQIPSSGAVNLHASLLPKYRGAAPIQWAILRGETITGVTTIMMDEGMDTGDILLQRETTISERDRGSTLHERLSLLGASLLSETVEKMKDGTIGRTPQDHSKATYAPSLKKEDGQIDWKKSAVEIDRQVRAFDLWPTAYTFWRGKILKIFDGEARKREGGGACGEVLWIGSDFIEVSTGAGSFCIRELQLEGGKRMNVRDFILGHRLTVGTVLG